MTTKTRSLDDLPGWLLPSLALVGLIVVWELVVVAFFPEDVDLLGAEAWIDELDLLASPRLHRTRRTLVQMQDLEHALSSFLLRPRPACDILQP